MYAVRFLSVVFVALALVPAGAHLMELPHKIELSAEDYLTMQQIYRGWAWAGIVVAGALLSTLALAFAVRARRSALVPALISFLCIVGSQVVFWAFTYPANRQTSNWTVLPANWSALRSQWEYAHAAGAVLTLVALVAVKAALLAQPE